MRPVPVRHKLQNPNEIRGILKQLGIPRTDWPAVVAQEATMHSRYLPYILTQDRDTQTWCAEGQDARGELFGVGAGQTPHAAQVALRAYVVESLLGAAADGDDLTPDLLDAPAPGECLILTPQELLPIRLRLERARQHLRQSDMAARLGLTQQAYQKLETPGVNSTLATILRLEQALGVALLRWG